MNHQHFEPSSKLKALPVQTVQRSYTHSILFMQVRLRMFDFILVLILSSAFYLRGFTCSYLVAHTKKGVLGTDVKII